ncbi:MAG: RHS repeat-associated core domain-containing protein [Acidobacteriota bacterium]
MFLSGQTPAAPAIDRIGVSDTGTRPYGSYDGVLDNVNLENNNLHLTVPILSLPGRNHFNLDLSLLYDSSIWRLRHELDSARPNPESGEGPQPVWLTQWAIEQRYPAVGTGWSLSWPTIIGSGSIYYSTGYTGNDWNVCVGSTTVTLQDGSRHTFANNAGCPAPYFINVIDSEDVDGMQLNCGGTAGCILTERNGTKIYFAGIAPSGGETEFGGTIATPYFAYQMTDKDGNKITLDTTPTGYLITDTVGRKISVNQPSSSNLVSSISYVDTNGVPQTISLQTATTNYNAPVAETSPYQYSLNSAAPFTDLFLQSVTINSGSAEAQTYSFAYNAQGELSKATYPHQGCTSYYYALQNRLVEHPLPEGYASNEVQGPHPMERPAGSSPEDLFMNAPGVVAKHVSPNCDDNYATTTYTASGGEMNNGQMIVGYPDHSSQVHYFTDAAPSQLESDHGLTAQEMEVDWLDASGVVLKKVETTYTGPHSWDAIQSVKTSYRSGSAYQVSAKTFLYDSITALYRPALYSSPDSVSHPVQPVLQTVSRFLDNPTQIVTYDFGTGAPGLPIQTVTKRYSNYTDPSVRILGLETGMVTSDGVQAFKSKFQYDTQTPTSVTAVQHSDPPSPLRGDLNYAMGCADVTASGDMDTCSHWISTHYTYDSTGNLLSVVDPLSHPTTFDWTDDWDESTCQPSAASNAYVTKVTDALGHYSTAKYRSCTGQRSKVTDLNRQQTSYQFDSLNRLQHVDLPDGGGETVQIDDASRTVTFTTLAAPDPQIVHRVTYDGIGRSVLSEVLSDPQGTDSTTTVYDGMDRVISKSNPYRGLYSSALPAVQFSYDALGRLTSQTQADSISAILTDYSQFPCITTTDEAGKTRSLCSDALERLASVVEDPGGLNLPTTYSYTATGDLKKVTQFGNSSDVARTRSFTYDGLSRLVTSTNPETGTICYGQSSGGTCQGGYDDNGNLLFKTDGSNIETDYDYDAVDRLTAKYSGYENSTNFFYTYDQGTNAVGRLSQEINLYGSSQILAGTQFQYGLMGRIKVTKWGNYVANQFSPGMQEILYDLAGNVIQLTYPDNRIVSQSWDGAGRLTSVNAGARESGGAPYVSGIQYYPSGAVQSAAYGSLGAVTQTVLLNKRLQPCHESASTSILPSAPSSGNLMDRELFYASPAEANCATATSDNGNIENILEGVGLTSSQTFSYDSLNRLTRAFSVNRPTAATYNQVYNYPDGFGNMLPVDQLHTPLNYGIDVNPTNRLTLNGDTTTGDLRYNDNGTLRMSPSASGGYFRYIYTGEGYLRGISDAGGNPFGTGSYLYDSMGERTLAVHSSLNTWNEYVYLNGQPVADVDNNGVWTDHIYANGQKIATATSAMIRAHLSGNRTDPAQISGVWDVYVLPLPSQPYTVQLGDKLAFKYYQHNANGGLSIGFTDGSNSDWYCGADQHGDCVKTESRSDQWVDRIVDLGSFAAGKTISYIFLLDNTGAPAGQFDVMAADVSIVGSNGVVTQILGRTARDQQVGDIQTCNAVNSSNWPVTCAIESVSTTALPGDSAQTVSYYLADQVGTTQMELTDGGWPVWQGYFTPFGQEIVNGGEQIVPGTVTADGTTNRYKFTGKERDAESGLDYFGARYYASNMGRWMSPDWSAKEEPVPYAKLDDPQSLNLYGYVRNNPLGSVDLDGHQDCGCQPSLADMIQHEWNSYWMTHRVRTTAEMKSEVLGWFHKGEAAPASTEQGRDEQGKFLPVQPGQTRPGAQTESDALEAEGASKNTKPLPGSTRIPDGTVDATGQKVEVKGGEVVGNIKQLVEMGKAAVAATGLKLLVVTTNPDVKVSRAAQRNPNLEIRPVKTPQ